jgi:hypothetical protein
MLERKRAARDDLAARFCFTCSSYPITPAEIASGSIRPRRLLTRLAIDG